MSKGMKIFIAILLGLFLIIGGTIAYIISAKFTAEKYEQAIFAQDENMQNVHSTMKNALKLQGFTVKNYTESDIKKMQIAIKRYADKPNMMVQWAKENGNVLSPKMHSKFMDAIEKFYLKWELSQKSKISVVQEYRTYLNASVKGSIASAFFNYPREKTQKIMDRIISTKKTQKTWETGVDEITDPFKN